MTIDVKATVLTALLGGPTVIAALILAAPAMADPSIADPVVPGPVIPVAAPATPAPASGPNGTVQTSAADPATPPPEGVPHLSSPENLPPGTTDAPVDGDQPRGLVYLRDIWHAYQTQEVSGRDALLLLAQRPLDPNAAPPPGMSPNPTPPQPLPAEPAPAPAPPLVP